MSEQQALFAGIRGRLRRHEPLARYTSWRIGGPADQLFEPEDLDDLAEFLRQLPDYEPITWLGLGSNALIRDGGIRGTVIVTKGVLSECERGDNYQITAGGGLPCAQLARRSAGWAMAGGEFFCGIPGTVGGALAMNAGAYGVETWERVVDVSTIDRNGELHKRCPADYELGYRSVKHSAAGSNEEWFVGATFEFAKDEDRGAAQRISDLLSRRADAQPMGERSCGSVFRNPEGRHAWQVVEACGLRGYRIGGAQVSEKHANFIVNTGKATADDVEALIDHIQKTAALNLAVEMIPEVRVLGDPISHDDLIQQREQKEQQG